METVLAHRITIEFEDFGWKSITAEAERQNISREELLVHAALYYLADLDSGRLAARILRSGEREAEAEALEDDSPPQRRFNRPDDTGS